MPRKDPSSPFSSPSIRFSRIITVSDPHPTPNGFGDAPMSESRGGIDHQKQREDVLIEVCKGVGGRGVFCGSLLTSPRLRS